MFTNNIRHAIEFLSNLIINENVSQNSDVNVAFNLKISINRL